MKFAMIAIYDVKAHAFLTPFFQMNLQIAVRSFGDVANDPGSVVCRNPEDFILYHLGNWDDGDGQLEQFPKPLQLGMAINFKKGGTDVRQVS